jgi:hypothetical protein
LRHIKQFIVGIVGFMTLIVIGSMPVIALECLAMGLPCLLEAFAVFAGGLTLGIGLIKVVLSVFAYLETVEDGPVIVTIPISDLEMMTWEGDAANEQNIREFLNKLRRSLGATTRH